MRRQTIPTKRRSHIVAVLPAFLAVALYAAGARGEESIIFPEDAGVVNVRDKYGAKGDGISDDTQAIQKAIDKVKGIPDTLYFPNGTYLVSDSVGIFNGKAHSRDRFLTYQGQSEAGTVIKLKDNCPGFGDPSKPRIVFSVYQGQGTGDYKSLVPKGNQAFRDFALKWCGKQPSAKGYWTEREHTKQWEGFNEETSAQIKKTVQEILDEYFPDGRPQRG